MNLNRGYVVRKKVIKQDASYVKKILNYRTWVMMTHDANRTTPPSDDVQPRLLCYCRKPDWCFTTSSYDVM